MNLYKSHMFQLLLFSMVLWGFGVSFWFLLVFLDGFFPKELCLS